MLVKMPLMNKMRSYFAKKTQQKALASLQEDAKKWKKL